MSPPELRTSLFQVGSHTPAPSAVGVHQGATMGTPPCQQRWAAAMHKLALLKLRKGYDYWGGDAFLIVGHEFLNMNEPQTTKKS